MTEVDQACTCGACQQPMTQEDLLCDECRVVRKLDGRPLDSNTGHAHIFARALSTEEATLIRQAFRDQS